MEAKSPMCIDEFGCNNFKKFNSRIDLEFRPITILIGPNNSGKSTIIKGLNFLNILKSSPEKEEILKYTNKFSELLNRDSKEKSFYISVKSNLISDFKFGFKFSFRDITIDNFKTDYIGSFLQKGRNAQIKWCSLSGHKSNLNLCNGKAKTQAIKSNFEVSSL